MFETTTSILFDQGPVGLLNHLVDLSDIAQALGRPRKQLQNWLFKNAGQKPESRHSQPFAEQADLMAQYLDHALVSLNARTDTNEVELVELVTGRLGQGAGRSATEQRRLALEITAEVCELHATRLAGASWRWSHALRSLLACLGGSGSQGSVDATWTGAITTAHDENETSLRHYQDLYQAALSLLPAMRPRQPDSVERFARATAWLADGYGVRVALQELAASSSAPDQVSRAHIDQLIEAVQALIDHHFDFADD